ncbi:MAG: hypothetical protein ABSB80_02150 [Methanoregula sp.]|jgi:hypothetical protein|uniref:DUF7288 family protein n=1 Tax=Methanoregula sp. TaxID=2052170 RepID=UPI003D14D380
MVDDRGQLYTIEGFAAAIIMVFTVLLVLGSTTVYTPGDSHISDLQLEQLGHDVLWTMSVPPAPDAPSPLQQDIGGYQPAAFNASFMNGINNKTGSEIDTLQYSASVTCRDAGNNIIQTPFISSRNLTGGEHAVRVTEWVLVKQTCPPFEVGPETPHAMLVEVLLWRE